MNIYYHVPGDREAKYCGGSQRVIDNYPEGHKMGTLSVNFDLSWLCSIQADDAKLTIRAYSTCATGQCGIMTDANGYEAIRLERVSMPWTQYSARNIQGFENIGAGAWKESKFTRYYPQDSGKWLLMWDLRTFHGSNGFLKVRLLNTNPRGLIVDTDRMVSEYQGMNFNVGSIQNTVSLAWLVDVPYHRSSALYAQAFATGGNIGMTGNGDGTHGMHAIKLEPGISGYRVQKGCKGTCGGGKKIFTGAWADLTGYWWNLPKAGKYTLVATVRTFATSAGWGKVKLSVDRAWSDCDGAQDKKCGLLVDDVGDDLFGTSAKITTQYDKKIFSLINLAATFTWSVEVTGAVRVMLQGMKSPGSGEIGLQNDNNGFASTIWYQKEETVPAAVKLE